MSSPVSYWYDTVLTAKWTQNITLWHNLLRYVSPVEQLKTDAVNIRLFPFLKYVSPNGWFEEASSAEEVVPYLVSLLYSRPVFSKFLVWSIRIKDFWLCFNFVIEHIWLYIFVYLHVSVYFSVDKIWIFTLAFLFLMVII